MDRPGRGFARRRPSFSWVRRASPSPAAAACWSRPAAAATSCVAGSAPNRYSPPWVRRRQWETTGKEKAKPKKLITKTEHGARSLFIPLRQSRADGLRQPISTTTLWQFRQIAKNANVAGLDYNSEKTLATKACGERGEKTCKGLDEACWRLNCSIGIISVAGNGVSRKRGANEEQKKIFV